MTPDKDRELLPCPFCGIKMYEGIDLNKGLVKHPLQVCALTDNAKDLWFDIKLWNTRIPAHSTPRVMAEEDIERIIWKYCSPLYEKDVEGHTHTLKADDTVKEIAKAINSKLTGK
jgi:hypothetical protein